MSPAPSPLNGSRVATAAARSIPRIQPMTRLSGPLEPAGRSIADADRDPDKKRSALPPTAVHQDREVERMAEIFPPTDERPERGSGTPTRKSKARLADIGFNSVITCGFKNEDQPRGVFVVENGECVRAPVTTTAPSPTGTCAPTATTGKKWASEGIGMNSRHFGRVRDGQVEIPVRRLRGHDRAIHAWPACSSRASGIDEAARHRLSLRHRTGPLAGPGFSSGQRQSIHPFRLP